MQNQLNELLKLLIKHAPAIIFAGGHIDMDAIKSLANDNGIPQSLVSELEAQLAKDALGRPS
jgi:hypothetical protein